MKSVDATRPTGRFEFTFTAQARLLAQPRRGLLLQIRPLGTAPHSVTSKYELKQCIIAGIDEVKRYPVIHTWSRDRRNALSHDGCLATIRWLQKRNGG
jgi:hypothetical protein